MIRYTQPIADFRPSFFRGRLPAASQPPANAMHADNVQATTNIRAAFELNLINAQKIPASKWQLSAVLARHFRWAFRGNAEQH